MSIDISSEQASDFHRDGAVLLKGVLERSWLDLLKTGIQEALDSPDGMSAGVDMPLRIDQFPASRSPALQRLLNESPIAGIVGEVRFV